MYFLSALGGVAGTVLGTVEGVRDCTRPQSLDREAPDPCMAIPFYSMSGAIMGSLVGGSIHDVGSVAMDLFQAFPAGEVSKDFGNNLKWIIPRVALTAYVVYRKVHPQQRQPRHGVGPTRHDNPV